MKPWGYACSLPAHLCSQGAKKQGLWVGRQLELGAEARVGARAGCWMGGWVPGPPQPPCCKGKGGGELCRGSRHTPVVVCVGPLSSIPSALPPYKVWVIPLRSLVKDGPLRGGRPQRLQRRPGCSASDGGTFGSCRGGGRPAAS